MIKQQLVLLAGLCLCIITGCFFAACTSPSNTSSINELPSSLNQSVTDVFQNSSDIVPGVFPRENHSSFDGSYINGTGKVLYVSLEGGFYGVVSDEGTMYLPESIPENFQKNGTNISFVFTPVEDSVSIFMWGIPVRIVQIKKLSDGPSDNESNERSAIIIEYERAGGILGAHEMLDIYEDQTGEVGKWNQVHRFTLSAEELKDIIVTFEKSRFTSFAAGDVSIRPVPDAMTYSIRYMNKSVKFTQSEVPEQIRPIITLLDSLLDRYTISPITANTTLGGTVWKLSMYLRSDDLPIIIGNNSPISLAFEKNQVVTGSSGCSSYSADYNHSGHNLSFGPISVAQVDCMDSVSKENEETYLSLLDKVSIVFGHEKILSMADENNQTLMIFSQIT